MKPVRHKALFENVDTLKAICCDVVLPNMTLRASDEELFEDDPIEYIRRDLEGSGIIKNNQILIRGVVRRLI